MQDVIPPGGLANEVASPAATKKTVKSTFQDIFGVFLNNIGMFKLYLVGQGRPDVEMSGVRRRNARG